MTTQAITHYVPLSEDEVPKRLISGKSFLAIIFGISCGAIGLLVYFIHAPQKHVPLKRKAMFNAVVDNEFVIFGGRSNNGIVLHDTWTYDTENGWQDQTTDVNPGGHFNGCFLSNDVDNELMMFGGETKFYSKDEITDYHTLSNELWSYSRKSKSDPWVWEKKFPAPNRQTGGEIQLSAPACGYIPEDKTFYMFGGRNADNVITNRLFTIDLKTNNYTLMDASHFVNGTLANAPLPSKGACAVSVAEFVKHKKFEITPGFSLVMLVHGGRVGNHYRKTLHALEIHDVTRKLKWTQLTSNSDMDAPPKRNHHGCTMSPGQMWVYGGRANHHSQFDFNLRRDLWYFDIPTRKWNQVDRTKSSKWPLARFLPAIAYDNQKEGLYIFGGQTDLGKVNNLWWADISHGPENTILSELTQCRGCNLRKHSFKLQRQIAKRERKKERKQERRGRAKEKEEEENIN